MGSCLSSSHPEVVLLPLVTSSTAGKSKATTTPIVHWIKRRYACKLELLAEKRGPTTLCTCKCAYVGYLAGVKRNPQSNRN